MQRIVTFKVTEELLKALDYYAKSRRMSRSEVIREALEQYLRLNGVDLECFRGTSGGVSARRGLFFEVVVD